MAQRVQTLLEDDFDGSEADESVGFGLDGAEYEIDLTAANAAELRDILEPWVAHARRTGGRRKRGARQSQTQASSGPSTADIRAWAQENGWDVPSRGRIPSNIRNAYHAAHR